MSNRASEVKIVSMMARGQVLDEPVAVSPNGGKSIEIDELVEMISEVLPLTLDPEPSDEYELDPDIVQLVNAITSNAKKTLDLGRATMLIIWASSARNSIAPDICDIACVQGLGYFMMLSFDYSA